MRRREVLLTTISPADGNSFSLPVALGTDLQPAFTEITIRIDMPFAPTWF